VSFFGQILIIADPDPSFSFVADPDLALSLPLVLDLAKIMRIPPDWDPQHYKVFFMI